MATNNSNNQTYSNDADGFSLAGGVVQRKIKLSGGDVEFVGGGSNPAAGNVLTANGNGMATFEPIVITKSSVGLGNVDNTSDANKPVSTAQLAALNAKQATLVSATNIKTVNGTTLLGSGNLVVSDTTYAVPSQAEAEAGSATTARAFSAQRVNQAIQALAPVKPADIANKITGSGKLTTASTAPSSPTINDVWIDVSTVLPDPTKSMGVVVHGGTAGAARPTGFGAVTWIGTVTPTNAIVNDIWYNG